MSAGNEGRPATAIEAIQGAELETAWGYEFYEGLLIMSRKALDAYGLKPIAEVKGPDDINEHDMSEISDGVPRLNVTVVGPDELERISAQMEVDTDPSLPGNVLYGIEDGRIDAIVGFAVTKEHSLEEQAAFFETLYGEEWPTWQGWLGTTGGYDYLLAHQVAGGAGIAAEVGLSQYRQRLGAENGLQLTRYYTTRVRSMVHQLFCTEEHLPVLNIPDAL